MSVLISFGSANAEEGALSPVKQYENAAGKLMAEMDEAQKASYGIFLASYSSLSAVKGVREAVKTGIGSCGLQNPDRKETYDSKFEAWNKALDETVVQADQVIENTIKVQRFAPVVDLREVVEYFDAAMAFRENEAKANEVPVSDLEGCDKLIDSMDETQENLTRLIRESFGLDRQDSVTE